MTSFTLQWLPNLAYLSGHHHEEPTVLDPDMCSGILPIIIPQFNYLKFIFDWTTIFQ